MLVYFSGDWDVHWGYGLLTHGQIGADTLPILYIGGPLRVPGFDRDSF